MSYGAIRMIEIKNSFVRDLMHATFEVMGIMTVIAVFVFLWVTVP